jgi:predicted ATP-grasp superfamily ATP-dependent carboligase
MAVDTSVPVVVLGFHHGSLGVARSLGRLGVTVYGVTGDRRAPALASRYCRPVVWDLEGAPRAQTIAFLENLGRRIGRQALLIPTTDATSLLVAEHQDALAARFLFPRVPAELVRSFSDKREVFSLARHLGIPTPAAVFPQSLDDVREFVRRAVFPVVLKGIDGTRLQARTGRKMVIVHSERDLVAQYVKLEDPESPNLMLQEYIPGGDDTIWMFNGYFDHASRCVAAFTGTKLRQHPLHGGATSLGVCRRNATLEAITKAFMSAVGYRGIVDVDYRYDQRDGSYKLLDPNPRIGCTFRLFLDAKGMDVVRFLYLDMTGQPLPAAVPCEGRKWIEEGGDIESSLEHLREGQLTVREWIRSLRGIDEAAWFARDDLRPFWRMVGRLARRALRGIARRVATAVGRVIGAPWAWRDAAARVPRLP